MQKKIVPLVLAVALLISGALSILSIHSLQGNARIINYAGVVRGATQRLIKQELNGQPNDALIAKLDGILAELSTGEGENELGRLEDGSFQSLVAQMQEQWAALKEEIAFVRQGGPPAELYQLSEEYFELADRTVSAAEVYSERQVHGAERVLFVLIAVFLLLAALLAWYSVVQDRRQQALEKAEDLNRIKRENLERMSESLRAPMDEISELMYVSDTVTYDLLFVNEAGRRTFGLTDFAGKKCYQAIEGRDSPCEFCTTPLLVPGENYTWEHTNPITKKHYLLKDRLILWEGRTARLETAFDITAAEEEKQALKNMLDAEQMVMECVRTLYQEHDVAHAVPTVLQDVGAFLCADRAYLGVVRGGLWYNDFEWCKDGISSQKDELQALPLSAIQSWLPVFARQECVVLEDLESVRLTQPDEYALLHAQGIHSLVAAPLVEQGQLWGLLGVDNPPPERMRTIASLLQTLSYFLLLAFHRSENERQLSQLSYYDTLTSFYNRNRFIEDSAALAGSAGPMGVIYLDVNGLKDTNDQYGHALGDQLLLNCTKMMREAFPDANAYRIGGDEFVLLCPGMARAPFEERAAELRRRFGADGPCHAAMGVQWAAQPQDLQQLIAKADAQMYLDKQAFYRQNPASKRYRHHSDEALHLSDPKVLQEELRQNHFVVYLQPQVSSSDRSSVAAEALIRYQPRAGSLMLPGSFLPLLEENQTASQIDFYVFEHICAQIQQWQAQGRQIVPVSVNFSRSSLAQPDFIARLNALCQKYEVDKRYLGIELTETAREPEGVDLKTLIHDLRCEGFQVSIDDFGTEYANLALLSMVEFDVLKLDKSLVDDLASNPKARTVVESIVGICKKMQIRVVAEGIETEEQLAVLRACGVETAQGFLFSKPIPADDYANQYL